MSCVHTSARQDEDGQEEPLSLLLFCKHEIASWLTLGADRGNFTAGGNPPRPQWDADEDAAQAGSVPPETSG